ncbi:MAG: riboflavin synthase [Albidovulum sp.]|nr:riboflavin synthase [Albidovulum sp.]MDE0305047.1 riboflavin synthase [Albidovulum sp.]MDE0532839.1 riboflavin synthase [Albidovulum sp.]
MFTGIVAGTGIVKRIERIADLKVRIETPPDIGRIELGASIACDGVCLTSVNFGEDWFEVEVSDESLSKTRVSDWKLDSRINLERPLRVGDEIGGHIVSGHVDGVASVESAREDGGSLRMELAAPNELAKFIAPKGSVALNGVSLTVNEVRGKRFTVNLISHTRNVTNLGQARVGSNLNMEIDALARYVARILEGPR